MAVGRTWQRWSPDMNKMLRDLWEGGILAREIASRISVLTGEPISASAIIGRARCMQLPKRKASPAKIISIPHCRECGRAIPLNGDGTARWQKRAFCGLGCAGAAKVRSLEERFWIMVDPISPNECWEWKGARNQAGYGITYSGGSKGRRLFAHRVSFSIAHKRIIHPRELVCHHCDNPPCVNPNHLFLGDHLANARDMIKKGRAPWQKRRLSKMQMGIEN